MRAFQPSRVLLDGVLLTGFCGFLFFFGLGSIGLIGADEPRYAQVAREMMNRHDWITPTLSGAPWLEKPPLYYWQAILAYRIFGVSDWAARIPSAADATLMVAAVYFFLRRFWLGIHLDGALMVAATAGVIGFARAASTDMPLAAMFTIAMLAWYAWFENRKSGYLKLFYFFLALGVLAKGPVAVLLAALVIFCFAIVKRDLTPIAQSVSIPGIALFCAIALPWYVAVQIRNPEFFRVFILEHNLARFGTARYHHIEPWWFFGLVMVLGLLPWIFFAFEALARTIRHLAGGELDVENNYPVFLGLWMIVPVIFFSISRSKLPGYILPAFPAGALLVSDYVRRYAEMPRLLRIVIHAVTASAPLVPALMIPYMLLEHKLPWGRPSEFAFGFAIVVALVITVTLKIAGIRVLRTVTLIPVVLAVAILVRFGSPAMDATLSVRSLASDLVRFQGRLGASASTIAVFEAPRETEYGLQFYLDRSIARYENRQIPTAAHIVIAPAGSQSIVAQAVAGRRVSYLGSVKSQNLDYFLVKEPELKSR